VSALGSTASLVVLACSSVFISACATSADDQAPRPEPDCNYAWPDPELPVALSSLRPGWKLFEGDGVDFGIPRQMFAILIAVHKTRGTRIMREPSDFGGVVEITSCEQALEYVRLPTSPNTLYLFYEKDFLEPARRRVHGFPSVAIEVIPGDAEPLRDGEVPREEFVRLGLRTPIVTAIKGGYRVRRCLAWSDSEDADGRYTVYWTEELVGHDGAYRIVSKSLASTNVEISFPGWGM